MFLKYPKLVYGVATYISHYDRAAEIHSANKDMNEVFVKCMYIITKIMMVYYLYCIGHILIFTYAVYT